MTKINEKKKMKKKTAELKKS